MTTPQNAAAHVAAGISLPAWLISMAANTLPLVQWIAGVVAIISGACAIAWYLKRLWNDL